MHFFKIEISHDCGRVYENTLLIANMHWYILGKFQASSHLIAELDNPGCYFQTQIAILRTLDEKYKNFHFYKKAHTFKAK